MVDERNAQALQAIKNARAALKKKDKKAAYAWAKRAAKLSPELEDSWLILAAVSKPENSIKFLRQALKVNPNSQRARKGLAWAQRKLSTQAQKPEPPKQAPRPRALSHTQPSQKKAQKASPPPKKEKKKISIFWAGAFLLLCIVGISFLAFSTFPVKALLGDSPTATAYVTAQHWAQGTIAKPTYTASPTATATATNTNTPTPSFTPTATFTATFTPTFTPTATLTPTITNTPLPTNTFLPTNTPRPVPTTAPPVSGGEHWLEVNLTQQRLYAYAGDTLVNSFLVSTGLWQTPTITGYFNVYLKYVSTTMSGPGYYLTNVPYTMYFSGNYGIHGTYWHNNFGTPMSHGCVNMRTSEAEWVYNFSPMGTLVYIHY